MRQGKRPSVAQFEKDKMSVHVIFSPKSIPMQSTKEKIL